MLKLAGSTYQDTFGHGQYLDDIFVKKHFNWCTDFEEKLQESQTIRRQIGQALKVPYDRARQRILMSKHNSSSASLGSQKMHQKTISRISHPGDNYESNDDGAISNDEDRIL